MNKEEENLDSDSYSKAPSKDSSSNGIEASHEEDSFFESERSIEPDNEKATGEDSATKKDSFSKKGWLFLIFILITVGAGGYFYVQTKGVDSAILPLDLNTSFPVNVKPLRSPATQSEALTIKPAPETIEQLEKQNTLEKPTFENETTINLLRNEIESLKTAISQKNKTPASHNIQNAIPHISGVSLGETTEEVIEEARTEFEPEMDTSLTTTFPPAKIKPSIGRIDQKRETEKLIQENRNEPEIEIKTPLITSLPVTTEPKPKQIKRQQTSIQRSKEVQAYLNFVENTGEKIFELVKEWSNRLLALAT